MDKNKVQKTVDKIDTTAVVLLRSFTNEETKEKLEYVSIEIPDLFGDEDFKDLGICPKWDDANSVFKYYAKKALRSTDKLEFPITLKPLTYHSVKKRKDVTYPGLVGMSPFNSRELEFKVKGKDKAAVFDELARKALGLSYTDVPEPSRETPDDDRPL